MEPSFWLERWEEGSRGFHRDDVHPDLVEHATSVFGDGGTVLVPLCGATLDLGWLRDAGYHALGVELSPIAAAEVAEREGLARVDDLGPYARFTGDGITVLVGDFFALEPAHTGPLAGIWDRAALVALHPDQRADYVALQRRLGGDRLRLLLNVLTYDQSVGDGPPWSIDDALVARLWPEARQIDDREGLLPPRLSGGGGRTRVYRIG